MRSRALAELVEALGACLVVLGLIFWSLPVALVAAGLFLLAVANSLGGAPGVPETPSAARGDRRVSR